MAELIALLMVTVGQLLGSGAAPAELSREVQAALVASSPFAVAEIEVEVTLEPPPEESTGAAAEFAGDSYRLDFEFTGIEIEPLTIEDLDITVGGIHRGDAGGLRIGWITFSAQITEQALREALKSHAPSISNPAVTVSRQGIRLGGGLRTWLGTVPFAVEGNLTVANQTQLVFTIDESRMAGIGIPAVVNNVIEHEVNPVYDLADFVKRSKKDIARARAQLDYEFYLSVEELTPQNGHIIVAGKA